MFKRLFFLSLMMGMVGIPYAVSTSSDWLKSVSSRFTASGDGKQNPADAAAFGGTPRDQARAEKIDLRAAGRTIEGSGAQDLGEVIRFDGTPEWVMSRWPRVTAGLAELELQGYRVPLVSGTAQDDLAGSLTYYFDKDRRVARIIFHGTTGDPRKLVSLVTSRYHFEPQRTDDPSLSLFQVKWNGKPHSELRIRPARVVRANQPNSRFDVDLAIRRP